MSPKELIRVSFSATIHWLNEEAGEAREVDWVVDSLEEAQAGDILVVSPEQANQSILIQAAAKKVGAILILGDLEQSQLDYPVSILVASIPGYQGLAREAQRLLLTTLINQRMGLVERSSRIYAQLSQMEAEGIGLEGLVSAIANICGRGALLQDKRGEFLACQSSSELSGVWENVLEQLYELSSLPPSIQNRKQVANQTQVEEQKIPGGLARMVVPIIVGGIARGYLSIVGLTGNLDVLDYLVAEQGSLVCAMEMARNKAIREAEKRLKGDLLTALLQENLNPRDALLWVQSMGMDPYLTHIALRFAWDGLTLQPKQESPSRRRLETIVNNEVRRSSLKAMVHGLATEVVCFCEAPTEVDRPKLALELAERVLSEATREYPKVSIRCGLGKPALGLETWRMSFQQAGQALELARHLQEERPLYYPDLSVYRLLFQLEHSPELATFQEEILGPLLISDDAGEMIHTLEIYFHHNGNLSQAAKALYIHRNTLIYRLERFAKITNLSLEKADDRLAVQLALRISRMMS